MESTLRHIASQDWITFVIIGTLTLLAVARIIDAQRFLNFIALPFSNRYFLAQDRTKKNRNSVGFLLLSIQFIIVPLSIYAILHKNNVKKEMDFNQLLLLFTGYLLFILGKAILIRILGYTLSIQDISSAHITHRLSYASYLSLFLFLFLISVHFIDHIPSVILNGLIWTLVGFFMLSILAILLKFKNEIIVHPFYFILYFCALEIAPYYILYKICVGSLAS